MGNARGDGQAHWHVYFRWHAHSVRCWLGRLRREVAPCQCLKFALLSPVAQQWLQARAKTTAGQTNLTLELCRAMPIPLPPVAEQLEVARLADLAIDSLNALDTARAHAVRQAAAQRQNILRAAFAGQLVPQDRADEPASVLLARIRAEREAMPAAARKPRKQPA